MTENAHTNRLGAEASPYLLQHKDNPVQWWPWCDEAFEEARRRDVPVFLSIGYATCHWCHVMAHESFEDEAVAALMNEAFVCIKVDREERPDLDDIYMAVCQATTGSGGWPLNVALTPDRQPFFAGTYFPKNSRAHRIGMTDLVPKLTQVWQEKRDDVIQSAKELVAHVQQAGISGEPTNDQPLAGEEALHAAFRQLQGRFDADHGGFGGAPKFPSPHILLFLLRYWKRTQEPSALAMVRKTLDAMARGGLRDHVGGGFHRYSTDPHWLLPHFEKMLYDQGMLAWAYTEGALATGDEAYEVVARDILDYVIRDLQQPDGGFASAEDADSEGEEGLFYTWTHQELQDALGDDAALFCSVYGARPEGNHDDESTRQPTGRNVLFLPETLAKAARRVGLTGDALETIMSQCRSKLAAIRSKRVRPLLDDKVLADWNGLMITALARAGQAFDEPRYVDAAAAAAGFVTKTMMPDGLRHRFRAGHLDDNSFLDDHAFMGLGLLDLYEATGDPKWLQTATQLAEELDAFGDEGGAFHLARASSDLVARRLDAYDGAMPSGNSAATLLLIRLARMTGDSAWEERAERVLRAFGDSLNRHSSAFAMMLCSVDFLLGPAKEIVIAGRPESNDTQELLATLRMAYQPNRVLLARRGDGGPSDQQLEQLAPWTAGHDPRNGKATAYVCTDHACQQPINDFHYLQRELE